METLDGSDMRTRDDVAMGAVFPSFLWLFVWYNIMYHTGAARRSSFFSSHVDARMSIWRSVSSHARTVLA